jgi:ADP-dependent phosphofructokinase/glucokinase
VGISEKTKKEDQRLRKELENADIGKLKEELKRILSPTKRVKKPLSKLK